MSKQIIEQMLRQHLSYMQKLHTQQANWVSGLCRAIALGQQYDIPDPDRSDTGDTETPAAEEQAEQLDGDAGRSDSEEER